MREARQEGGGGRGRGGDGGEGVERRSEAWLVQKAPPSCKWMENCDGAERAESASRARRDNETERQLEKLEKNFGSWPQDGDDEQARALALFPTNQLAIRVRLRLRLRLQLGVRCCSWSWPTMRVTFSINLA